MAIDDAYKADLAYIHDTGHGCMAREAAERLLEELARTGRRSGTVVDLGCGSGILAEHALDAGYRVLGVDVSPAMVALARQRAPRGEFHVGSFLSTAFPRCVAVTAIGEVLNYTFDPANDQRARDELIARVYRALVPGGLLMFDVAGPDRAKTARQAFSEGPDWTVRSETTYDDATGVLIRNITSVRQVGATSRRDTEVHRLILLDPAAVRERLSAAGFDVDVTASYGTTVLPRGVVVFLARKRRENRAHASEA